MVEHIEEKCKVCGLGVIEHDFAICDICGWEADDLQNDKPDYIGGANEMSLNQYKQFWKDCKDKILQYEGVKVFYAIEMAREYYEKHFKKRNEAYYRSQDPLFDEKEKMIEENCLKQRIELLKKIEKEKNEKTEEEIRYEEENASKGLNL